MGSERVLVGGPLDGGRVNNDAPHLCLYLPDGKRLARYDLHEDGNYRFVTVYDESELVKVEP